MEIIIEIPQDINKLCRTCMTVIKDDENENLVTCEDEETNSLCSMLKYVTDLNVTTTDGLPTFMCNTCVNKLHIAYIFKEQCENTYLNFQEIFSSDTKDLNESKSDADTNLNCAFCSHCSPTSYHLSKHLVKHHTDRTLLSRYLANRGQQNCSVVCSEVDAETDVLIEKRKEMFATKAHDGTEQVNGIISKREYKEEAVANVSTGNGDTKPHVNSETAVVKMCDLCDRIFSSELRLSLHFVSHALLVESDTDPNIFDQYIFCANCGQSFEDKNELKLHTGECPMEQSQQYECLKCALVFDNEFNLLKHEKYVDHNGDYFWDEFLTKSISKEIFCCPVCGQSFSKKKLLNLHSVTHVVKKILCRLCRKLFCTQVAYNEHLRTHPNYKHICDVCGKCLGSKHALKMHVMGIHSVTKNYVCVVCSKAFKTPGRLYIHKLTHRTDKKFVCSYCAYRTNNVGDFKVHNRIHTSERPYKCNFVNCTKRFKTSSHLNEHIQRHLQIKKFQCNMCEMVFGHSHTLKMHLMVHTGEKPFHCDLCKAKFRRKHHLKNHMKQHANVSNFI